MIRFLDGPAAGESLLIRRGPIYLRAVVNEAGEWDALDQPGDRPKRTETIFAYRLKGQVTWVHVRFGGKDRRKSGRYVSGEYEFIEPQPDEATMRDQARWQTWATAQYESEHKGE